MKNQKGLNWDAIVVKLFYVMAALISIYVATSLDKLTKSVTELNIEMRGMVVQLSSVVDVNRDLKEKSETHAKVIYDHEVRILALEAAKR